MLGLLGHNGAGKTTAIRILTTLAQPTSGEARVAGFDVATEGARVRERIGVAGQSATVDDLLTAQGEPRDGRPPLPPPEGGGAAAGRTSCSSGSAWPTWATAW